MPITQTPTYKNNSEPNSYTVGKNDCYNSKKNIDIHNLLIDLKWTRTIEFILTSKDKRNNNNNNNQVNNLKSKNSLKKMSTAH